ncbi:hypothetical protein HHK36_001574 [Tetracentron sinense]|uniref:C2 domain-containing protein n=1 Tax=Tetracentron sinense TaxID=13715 RepID=A0A835DS58_TETSI|nr:hypothetical protein HHK36_001574 [Tetracentron sinense]
MDITEVSIIHHIGIVLILLWILSYFGCCPSIVYFISLIYIYQVLSDSETVRWLNHAVEKIWPVCMEQIVSQKFLLPIIPWFLEKYKPWTAKKAVVQHLYMGRNPPIFTEVRVLHQSADDDHLVLELGMNFLAADDMSAILAVKLRKRLGFGIWAKMHMTGMHVEGKILVGLKFLREWPFLGRLRVCFVEPPYFQMTVKPIFTHGFDVTELPGIAGWMDKLLAMAFEQTLVEPNMLVVDMEKFASEPTGSWFSVDEKETIAYAKVEVIEAADLKPSDLNGLADPYVKGQLGPYRFRTKTQKKTLAPKWQEEFKIPICTWDSPNVLVLEVRDKDHFRDDILGDCSVNIGDLRGGQRHDMWLSLRNIKMGRLHLAVTVIEVNGKVGDHLRDEELSKTENPLSLVSETAQKCSNSTVTPEKVPKVADKFEPINIEGQDQTGIWAHHPGSDISQSWEPRKGKNRHLDTHIHREDNDSTASPRSAASRSHQNDNSSNDENRPNPISTVRRSLRKISSVFHSSPMKEDLNTTREAVPSPHVNLRAVNEKGTVVTFIMDDSIYEPAPVKDIKADESSSSPESGPESPSKGNMKGMAKSILKHARKSAHSIKHALSRKGSNKSRGQESNSSDEESLSLSFSPIVKGIPIDSTAISGLGNESPNSKNQEGDPCDSAINSEDSLVKEVCLPAAERTDDDIANCSDVHGEGLGGESLNPNPSEGNSEPEKR